MASSQTDEPIYYSENYGGDPDYPQAPNCTPRAAQIEQDASEALRAYIAMGFDADPNKVGPVVEGRGGAQVNRIFITRNAPPDYAQVLSSCTKTAFLPKRLSQIHVNAAKATSMPALMVRIAVMHEVFHVIQNSNAFFGRGNPAGCRLPKWISEGTPDALALSLGPGPHAPYREGVEGRYAHKIYGMRDYSNDLRYEVAPENKLAGDVAQPTPEYSTSSMWTHLSDHYFKGKWRFLANWFSIDYEFDPGFLPWLAVNFEAESKVKFYFAYPNFLTEYAVWGGTKFPHLDAEAWRKKTFHWGDGAQQTPGCKTVELSKNTSKAGVTLYPTFHQLSGRCLKVKVTGLSNGEIATVKIAAYHNESEALDRLHLGTAELSDIALEYRQPFNCYEAGTRSRGVPVCLQKPFTGEIPKPLPNTEPSAPAHAFAKTWLSMRQRATDDALENIYVVTHTPLTLRDSIDEKEIFKGYRLDIALDYSGYETSDEGKARKADGTAGMGGDEPLPMDGTGAAGPGSSPLGNAIFAHVGISIPKFDAEAGGISMFTLTAMHEVLKNDEIVLDEGDKFLIMLEDVIGFGETGQHDALLVGTPSGDKMNMQELRLNWPAEKPARVTVERYDELAFVVSVEGGFCRLKDYDEITEECRNPVTFSGRLLKPFGWAYDPDNRFNPVSTPGMQVYAETFERNLARRFGGGSRKVGPGPLAEPDGAPPRQYTSTTITQIPGCDCSCENYLSLLSISDGMNRGEAPPDDMEARLQDMQKCMPSCGQTWAQCRP